MVIPESDSDKARQLLRESAIGAIDLLSPDVFVAEVVNTLWKQCRLAHTLTELEASEALRFVLVSLPPLVPTASLAVSALNLSLMFRRPVYDCLYVALALQQDATLITADERLVRQVGPSLAHIVALRDWTG